MPPKRSVSLSPEEMANLPKVQAIRDEEHPDTLERYLVVYGNYWWAIPMSMLSQEEIQVLDTYHSDIPQMTDKVWVSLEGRLVYDRELNKYRRNIENDRGTMLEKGSSVAVKFSWLQGQPEVD